MMHVLSRVADFFLYTTLSKSVRALSPFNHTPIVLLLEALKGSQCHSITWTRGKSMFIKVALVYASFVIPPPSHGFTVDASKPLLR
jgi:hypothetical protein